VEKPGLAVRILRRLCISRVAPTNKMKLRVTWRTTRLERNHARPRVLDTWIPLVAAGYDAPRAKTFQDELMQRVGEGKVARLERRDQPNSKRNDEANGRTQPEHTAVDLSGQVHHISSTDL